MKALVSGEGTIVI